MANFFWYTICTAVLPFFLLLCCRHFFEIKKKEIILYAIVVFCSVVIVGFSIFFSNDQLHTLPIEDIETAWREFERKILKWFKSIPWSTVLEWTGNIVGAIYFCLWGIVLVIAALDGDGAAIYGLSGLVITIVVALLQNHFWITFICLLSVLVIAIVTYKVYKKLLHNISAYNNALSEFELTLKELKSNNKVFPQFKKEEFLYCIGEDNLPKEKNSTGWGKTFTFYTTSKGNKLHRKRLCCGARIETHVYKHLNYIDLKSKFCQKCCENYNIPGIDWYNSCIEKRKYESMLSKTREAESFLTAIHDKCNTKVSKFFLLFSKKSRCRLKDMNIFYNRLIGIFCETHCATQLNLL